MDNTTPLAAAGQRFFYFDTETHLISATLPVPPFVCMGSCINDDPADLTNNPGRAVRTLYQALRDPACLIIGHNVFYDLAVMIALDASLFPLVWAAFEDGRIRDTWVRQRLLDIRDGRPEGRTSLEVMCKRYFGLDLSADKRGEDAWRLRYRELATTPLADWPEDATRYAKEDAAHTRDVYLAQGQGDPAALVSPDELDQTKASWALHLMSVWGMVSDPDKVEAVAVVLQEQLDALTLEALEAGLMKTNIKLTWDHEAMLAAARETLDVETLPKWCVTKAGKMSMGAKTLTKLAHRGDQHEASWHALVDIKTAPPSCPPALLDAYRAILVKAGWLGVVTTHSRNSSEIKRRVKAALGDKADDYLTPKGGQATDQEALTEAAKVDPDLGIIARRGRPQKYLSTYIKALRQGIIHPRYGLKDTGRTSSSGPNVQNYPRKGGIRECHVPRQSDWCYVQADYTQVEMVTLAVLLDTLTPGEDSSLTKALRAGKDCHIIVAAILLEMTYEDAKAVHDHWVTLDTDETLAAYALADPAGYALGLRVAEFRQLSKVANYGYAGGMGEASFIDYAWKGYEVEVSPEMAKVVREAWFEAWPEVRLYFAQIAKIVGSSGHGQIKQHFTGRLRGGVGFCAGANSGFQGLAADGAKAAMWLITYECYLDQASPLYGYRPCAFIHDEWLLEGPQAGAAAALDRLMVLMIRGMVSVMPGYPVKADGKIMRECWTK